MAGAAGCAAAVLERRRRWSPSGVAMGVGFLVPASTAATLFLGGLLAAAARRREEKAAAIGAGLIAGESLLGVVLAALLASGLLR
jgi:uncharacterized oligopeptide transporter (OPT) family protein